MPWLEVRALMAPAVDDATSPTHGLLAFASNASRAANFWRQTASIYGSYKATQAQEGLMRVVGRPQAQVDELWDAQNERAGKAMYNMCVELRGFYLKVCCMHACMRMQVCRLLHPNWCPPAPFCMHVQL